MLFGASRSAVIFVLLVLFVSLSIFLLPSHSSSLGIRHVYQRQLSDHPIYPYDGYTHRYNYDFYSLS
jgi:hypothetical protein